MLRTQRNRVPARVDTEAFEHALTAESKTREQPSLHNVQDARGGQRNGMAKGSGDTLPATTQEAVEEALAAAENMASGMCVGPLAT